MLHIYTHAHTDNIRKYIKPFYPQSQHPFCSHECVQACASDFYHFIVFENFVYFGHSNQVDFIFYNKNIVANFGTKILSFHCQTCGACVSFAMVYPHQKNLSICQHFPKICMDYCQKIPLLSCGKILHCHYILHFEKFCLKILDFFFTA